MRRKFREMPSRKIDQRAVSVRFCRRRAIGLLNFQVLELLFVEFLLEQQKQFLSIWILPVRHAPDKVRLYAIAPTCKCPTIATEDAEIVSTNIRP